MGRYVPGRSYTVRLAVETPGDPAAYGFQAVALDDVLDAAGTYGAPPDGFQITELSGRPYLEHARRQPSSSVEVVWVAPAAGTGTVTFYAAANAVNGADGSSGDNADEAVATLAEEVGTSTLEPALVSTRLGRDGAGALRLILPSDADLAGLTYAVSDLSGREIDGGGVADHRIAVGRSGGGPYVATLRRRGRLVWRTVYAY